MKEQIHSNSESQGLTSSATSSGNEENLENANSPLSPNKYNLTKYFGSLIRDENVFYKDYKIQDIGNCAWLISAFVIECSKLNNFEEVEKQINNGELLVNTVNRTSELMHENLGKLLVFNEDETIILNENISKSKAINISRLCSESRNRKIEIINDKKIVDSDKIESSKYKNNQGEEDYNGQLLITYKKITQTESFIDKQNEMFKTLKESLKRIGDTRAVVILEENEKITAKTNSIIEKTESLNHIFNIQ